MKYTVQFGDTLYSISKEHYGKSSFWRLLALVNFKFNPNLLFVGEEIRIPFKNKWR